MTSTEIILGPTSAEKRFVAAYLTSSCDELTEAVSNVSFSQASFRCAPGEWSITDIVEHLAILEGRIQSLLSLVPNGTPADPNRNAAEIDQLIIEQVPLRTSRTQAPEASRPTGQCTLADALADFRQRREQTVRLLESAPCLRGRTVPHPIFGHWDGYQWMLAISAHTARHLAQICEVQSHKSFPEPENVAAS